MMMDGKRIKNEILDELKEKVRKLSRIVGLVVIQVGNNEASNVYIKQKENMALYVGYKFNHVKLNEDITTEEIVELINKLNDDDSVHGILVQMPLPNHIDSSLVQNSIRWDKDVDGLCDVNAGMLSHNRETLYPCTPFGILELLKRYRIAIQGKHVVIVGRSVLVGKPMAMMMINEGATVTVCHSKTENLENYTKMADILIVAIGKDRFITSDMVKENAVVIDVGISRVDGNLYGDVDYENVKNKVAYITPVPGGVGQMTVAMLAMNVYRAYQIQK